MKPHEHCLIGRETTFLFSSDDSHDRLSIFKSSMIRSANSVLVAEGNHLMIRWSDHNETGNGCSYDPLNSTFLWSVLEESSITVPLIAYLLVLDLPDHTVDIQSRFKPPANLRSWGEIEIVGALSHPSRKQELRLAIWFIFHEYKSGCFSMEYLVFSFILYV